MKIIDIHFSTPNSPKVHKMLFDVFMKTNEKTKVRGSMYMWGNKTKKELEKNLYWSPQKLNMLIEDKATNQDFRIITDGFNEVANQEYFSHLKNKLNDKITVTKITKESDPYYRNELVFKNKKRSEGYLHSKFFTFSHLEGMGDNIVIFTSANLNYTQYYQYNDATILQGKEVYDLFNNYYESLLTNQKIENEQNIFFFPNTPCPIEKQIDYYLENNVNFKIKILMSFLTKNSLKNKLILAKKQGNEIDVVISNEALSTPCAWILKTKGIKIRRTRNDDWMGRMHHKIVMFETEKEKTTFNGTYNATKAANTLNNDFIIKFDCQNYFNKCNEQFEYIKGKTRLL